MKHRILFSIIFAAALALTACTPEPTPTATATNTNTPEPTSTATNTPTPEPTATATATETPMPTSTIYIDPTEPDGSAIDWMFGDGDTRIQVFEGGYSFNNPFISHPYLEDGMAIMSEDYDGLIIALFADEIEPGAVTEMELLLSMEGFAEHQYDDQIEFSGKERIELGNFTFLFENFSGKTDNYEVAGSIAVLIDGSFALSTIGLNDGDTGDETWEENGYEDYLNILASLELIDIEALDTSCIVSDDPTYGYDPANPIRVAGGVFGGAAREKEYLNSLAGPNGEVISYEREGSMPSPSEEIILDKYVLTYPGLDTPIILYLDMYNWDRPLAPLGLTCSGPMTLQAP